MQNFRTVDTCANCKHKVTILKDTRGLDEDDDEYGVSYCNVTNDIPSTGDPNMGIDHEWNYFDPKILEKQVKDFQEWQKNKHTARS